MNSNVNEKNIPYELLKIIQEVKEELKNFEGYAELIWNIQTTEDKEGNTVSIKNKYSSAYKTRFNNLFDHWENCTKALITSENEYYLSPSKFNKSATKKSKNLITTVYKTKSVIENILSEGYYSGDIKKTKRNPKYKIGIVSKEKEGYYRFSVSIGNKDSIVFLKESLSNNGNGGGHFIEKLSKAERLLKSKEAILEAIRIYQDLILASDKFHMDIITSIVHQIRIRSEYKGRISSVYPEIQDIDQPLHGMRNVVENLFKLLARNYKNFKRSDRLFFNKLYFARLDLRRINFSTKSSNQYENSLRYANFNGCNIGWTAFNGMDLTGANFANISCARAAMFNKKTILKDVNFYNSDLRHINHDPASGSIITEDYDPSIFIDVKTMYCAYLDKDLEDYLREKKLSLFDPL